MSNREFAHHGKMIDQRHSAPTAYAFLRQSLLTVLIYPVFVANLDHDSQSVNHQLFMKLEPVFEQDMKHIVLSTKAKLTNQSPKPNLYQRKLISLSQLLCNQDRSILSLWMSIASFQSASSSTISCVLLFPIARNRMRLSISGVVTGLCYVAVGAVWQQKFEFSLHLDRFHAGQFW